MAQFPGAKFDKRSRQFVPTEADLGRVFQTPTGPMKVGHASHEPGHVDLQPVDPFTSIGAEVPPGEVAAPPQIAAPPIPDVAPIQQIGFEFPQAVIAAPPIPPLAAPTIAAPPTPPIAPLEAIEAPTFAPPTLQVEPVAPAPLPTDAFVADPETFVSEEIGNLQNIVAQGEAFDFNALSDEDFSTLFNNILDAGQFGELPPEQQSAFGQFFRLAQTELWERQGKSEGDFTAGGENADPSTDQGSTKWWEAFGSTWQGWATSAGQNVGSASTALLDFLITQLETAGVNPQAKQQFDQFAIAAEASRADVQGAASRLDPTAAAALIQQNESGILDAFGKLVAQQDKQTKDFALGLLEAGSSAAGVELGFAQLNEKSRQFFSGLAVQDQQFFLNLSQEEQHFVSNLDQRKQEFIKQWGLDSRQVDNQLARWRQELEWDKDKTTQILALDWATFEAEIGLKEDEFKQRVLEFGQNQDNWETAFEFNADKFRQEFGFEKQRVGALLRIQAEELALNRLQINKKIEALDWEILNSQIETFVSTGQENEAALFLGQALATGLFPDDPEAQALFTENLSKEFLVEILGGPIPFAGKQWASNPVDQNIIISGRTYGITDGSLFVLDPVTNEGVFLGTLDPSSGALTPSTDTTATTLIATIDEESDVGVDSVLPVDATIGDFIMFQGEDIPVVDRLIFPSGTDPGTAGRDYILTQNPNTGEFIIHDVQAGGTADQGWMRDRIAEQLRSQGSLGSLQSIVTAMGWLAERRRTIGGRTDIIVISNEAGEIIFSEEISTV